MLLRRARRGLGRARQIERDGRALADFGLDADIAAGLAGEAENLAEAEPGALADGLGGEEGFENAVHDFAGHAVARIADADADIVSAHEFSHFAIGERD